MGDDGGSVRARATAGLKVARDRTARVFRWQRRHQVDRKIFIGVLAVVGATLGVALAGNTHHSVGRVKAQFALRPTLHGGTEARRLRRRHGTVRLVETQRQGPSDGHVVDVAGIRIAGIGDPLFTPDKTNVEDDADSKDALFAAGQRLTEAIRERITRVDVALVHDPASIVYFDRTTHRLVAVDDVTVGGLGGESVQIERHSAESYQHAVPSQTPSSSPAR